MNRTRFAFAGGALAVSAVAIALLLVLLASPIDIALASEAVQPSAPSAAVTITILHTNDVHGHVDEFNRDHSACKPESATDCIGGAARLATKIEEIRGANPNVLLVDGGDQFQGTLYYNLFKADIVTITMNALGYDAMAIGNHEFDDGPGELARLIDGADFPVLSANIDASASLTLTGKIAPSTIVTRSGERIGIVGLTTPDTSYLSSPGPDVTFNDPVTSVQAAVNDLTTQGVDKIIVLTHLGYDEDLALAQVITGVDVIVGGHSHTFIYTPTTPITFTPPQYPRYSPLEPEGSYPTVVNDLDGNPVLIVHDYYWGTFLGRLDVSFDANGIVSSFSGNPIYMANTITKSVTIENIITPTFKVPVQALMNTMIGTTTVELPLTVGGNRICRVRECLLGNLVADALLWKINSIDPSDQYQIAFQNGGGLRTSIDAGPVSIGEVIEVLPFGNSIATFELTGTHIITALENGVGRYPNYDGRFPQVAGMHYVWSANQASGSRIVSVEVLSGTQYVPLDPNAIYKVATNDFMRQGGDGYTVFRDFAIAPYDYGPPLDQALKEYFETFSPVTPVIEGRIEKLELSVVKEVTPTADVPLGGTVTYSVTLDNSGDVDATGVVMTDTLPPEVDFGGWLNRGSAMLPGSDVITWGPYTATAGMDYTFSFTATVKTGTLYYAAVVTNTVEFDSDNAGSGFSNDAIFTVEEGYKYIYLPLVMRNY